VYVWGWNSLGQLGATDAADRHEPTLVPGLDAADAIAAGEAHACALTPSGLWGWGSNASGQIGAGGRTQLHASLFMSSR